MNTSRFNADSIADFVDHEAELADTHRLEEWLDLWNPARAEYLVPIAALPGRQVEVSIIRDNYARLVERIRRLRSGNAYAQDPPSVLSRLMGRLHVEPGDDGSVVAASRFVCVEIRPNRETIWAGKAIYTLGEKAEGAGLEMWRKEVRLVNSHIEIPTLSFLI